MRRFATTFALLTIALSAAACDPYQAITNSLPGGCNPPGAEPTPLHGHDVADQAWTAHPTPTLPGPHQKGLTSQHEDVRPAEPPKSGTRF